MQLTEAKEKFIQSWGSLGSQWGINRTMAQIHALLLVSHEALTTEDIMESLQVSRGNANMNLRELINWQLVQKELKPGERKEFFVAEKDMWKVFRLILRERKKREIDPMIQVIRSLQEIEGSSDQPDIREFREVMEELETLTHKGERLMDLVIHSDEHWFISTFLKLMR
jgi:DNA-binding transcriptional regulator GbsR (MarR family)